MPKFYKLLNEDLTCQDYQFEIGKIHSCSRPLVMSHHGFHACTDPKACALYYDPDKSRLFEVEISGENLTYGPKVASRCISLLREIIGQEKSDLLTGKCHWSWPDSGTTKGQMVNGKKVGRWHFSGYNGEEIVHYYDLKGYLVSEKDSSSWL